MKVACRRDIAYRILQKSAFEALKQGVLSREKNITLDDVEFSVPVTSNVTGTATLKSNGIRHYSAICTFRIHDNIFHAVGRIHKICDGYHAIIPNDKWGLLSTRKPTAEEASYLRQIEV